MDTQLAAGHHDRRRRCRTEPPASPDAVAADCAVCVPCPATGVPPSPPAGPAMGGVRRRAGRRASAAAMALAAFATLVVRAGALTNPTDKAILLQLYNSTQGDGWREGFRWTRGE